MFVPAALSMITALVKPVLQIESLTPTAPLVFVLTETSTITALVKLVLPIKSPTPTAPLVFVLPGSIPMSTTHASLLLWIAPGEESSTPAMMNVSAQEIKSSLITNVSNATADKSPTPKEPDAKLVWAPASPTMNELFASHASPPMEIPPSVLPIGMLVSLVPETKFPIPTSSAVSTATTDKFPIVTTPLVNVPPDKVLTPIIRNVFVTTPMNSSIMASVSHAPAGKFPTPTAIHVFVPTAVS